ncbi:MAG: hypothetical protein NWF00_06555 [Candidatus Bathyarchaeota archaeon]|nr:hypothetical protein [Candidatus Bathyarchaeota archaeon]
MTADFARAADYTDPQGDEFELINGRLFPKRYFMPDGKIYVVQKIRGEKKLVSFGRSLFEPLSVYRKDRFSPKQKRHFMRLKSGMTLGEHKRERLCFMTLSTQYDVKRDRFGKRMVDLNGRSVPERPEERKEKIKFMNYAFTKLKQQIEYYLTQQTYEKYCRKTHREPYARIGKFKKKAVKYPKLWQRCRFKFKYFKVKTDEGGGVMHIVFRKGYNVPKVPFQWLSDKWAAIWGSPRVNISQIKVRSASRLSMYMVGQYFAKQPVLRMSYGRQWVCEGFKKSFSHIADVYGFKRAKEIWDKNLKSGFLPTGKIGRQTRFDWRDKPCPKNCSRKGICSFGDNCHCHAVSKKLPRKEQGVVGFYVPKTVQTLVDSPKYLEIVDGLNMVYTIFTKRRMKSQKKLPDWKKQEGGELESIYEKTSRYRFEPQKKNFVPWIRPDSPYPDFFRRWRIEHGYE